MRILVIGATGMLGNAIFKFLSDYSPCEIFGTTRSENAKKLFRCGDISRLISGIDVDQQDSLLDVFTRIQPNIVINCVGLIKQLSDAVDPLQAIPINALLPHRLARMCELTNSRLIHMSTDCVFSGKKGSYSEDDLPDAQDLYGRSKLLGEVIYPHTVTLRTSIIGHELQSSHGLVGWFLSQECDVKGYKRAIFSGLPTVELARVIRDHVIPRSDLHGVYHVSAEPISKFDLLTLVAKIYGKSIDIISDEQLVIDRSLDSTRFRQATGFAPKPWPELVSSMRDFG